MADQHVYSALAGAKFSDGGAHVNGEQSFPIEPEEDRPIPPPEVIESGVARLIAIALLIVNAVAWAPLILKGFM